MLRDQENYTHNWHYTLKQKWKWKCAGHIEKLKDNRWTKHCIGKQPRRGKRSRGQPSRRWQDDTARKEGTTWNRQATEDNGRHWWRATSCSGWTKPRWKVKQESNRQRTMEGIDGGLHPAVDGQSLGERWNRKATEDNGRHWWRATSCSGWTKPRWKVKQESNRQRTMEGTDGGLHPAVDGQSLGEKWNRKATDRGQWKALMEGYILQWMDKA